MQTCRNHFGGEVKIMRRRRKPKLLPGLICLIAGMVIILSMVLPAKFWWFMLGGCLVSLGLYFMRC